MKKLVTMAAFLLNSQIARAEMQGTTAIILAASPSQAAPTTIDFYQDVVRFIDATKSWNRLPNELVSQQLQRAGYGSNLGGIPLLAPKHLDNNRENGLIKPVQALLDSLAIPSSIIVSCAETSDAKIKACSLFYYDRNKQRILASAEKNFTVPIRDVTRWAPVMVKTLASGLETTQKKGEREAFEKLLNREDDSEDKAVVGKLLMQGEQTGLGSGDIGMLPQLYVALQYSKQGRAFGIEGSMGKRSGESSESSYEMQSKAFGLALNLTTPALETLLWDLGLGLGYKERSLNVDASAARLKDRSIYFALRPGFYFLATKNLALGLESQLTSYLNNSSESDDGLSDKEFKRFSLAMGMGLRMEF